MMLSSLQPYTIEKSKRDLEKELEFLMEQTVNEIRVIRKSHEFNYKEF